MSYDNARGIIAVGLRSNLYKLAAPMGIDDAS